MVDVQPTDTTAIDPPLGESDAPLMGNPILTRTTTRRSRGPAGSKVGWQAGVAAAAVVLVAGAAAAYFVMKSSSQPLMTNPAAPTASAPAAQPTTPPPAVASTAPPTAAPVPPTEAAPPPAAAGAAPRHERVTRMARADRTDMRASRHATVRKARAAEEAGVDVSATAPAPKPAAPSPPPVITPPLAQ
jgi:hypothetical protein